MYEGGGGVGETEAFHRPTQQATAPATIGAALEVPEKSEA